MEGNVTPLFRRLPFPQIPQNHIQLCDLGQNGTILLINPTSSTTAVTQWDLCMEHIWHSKYHRAMVDWAWLVSAKLLKQ